MEEIIIIRYGELSIKSKNKIDFINKLKQNIKKSLKEFIDLKYVTYHDHIEISNFLHEQKTEITEKIKIIFGISNFSWGWKLKKDFDYLEQNILQLLNYDKKLEKTFKMFVSRTDKKFIYDSQTVVKKLSSIILKNTNLKVDVQNPEISIYIKIKSKSVYLFDNKIEGAKGLPVGSSGRVLLLLSGGIDSPVAAYKLMKRGLEVIYLHFATPPVTSEEALNKVVKLVDALKVYNNYSSNLYTCNFLSLQNELMHISLESYRITLMRRMFLIIANKLAQKLDILVLGTGECLGQVASQTVASINVINAVSNVPILRPLIADDKNEIINIAKKIGTYDLSIMPFEDCCSLFVPKKPVTNPKEYIAQKIEAELNELINIEHLIDEICENITKVKKIG